MAKIYVSRESVLSGFWRWMLRISAWYILLSSLAAMYIPYAYSMIVDEPIMGVVMGGVLIVLDIFLPDPRRQRRKAEKKLEKAFWTVCNALPSNNVLPYISQNPNWPQTVTQVRCHDFAGKALFQQYPFRETLEFIHANNMQTAYQICADLVKAAQNADKK